MRGLVYAGDVVAAELYRDERETVFRYRPEYVAHASASIASTLDLAVPEVRLPGTAVPPFFAGLLPEGRRLNALQRAAKASADDDLALLLAVADDTIGDVSVLTEGVQPSGASALSIAPRTEDLDFETLRRQSGVIERPRLAGVQDKASAQMLTVSASRRGERMLLKFAPETFAHLVENEQFCLELARRLSISTVRSNVLVDRRGETALSVLRFDRRGGTRVHVEDGAQALGVYPGDKYNVSFEAVAGALAAVTVSPVASKMNLMTQLLFAWLTGNADQHAKNLAVVGPVGQAAIAPLYDSVCTLLYGDLDPEMALTVMGSKTLTKNRFIECGRSLGLSERILHRISNEVVAVTAPFADQIEAGALPFDQRTRSKAARQLRTRHRAFS